MRQNCKCVYESECHGIEMIKTPSGEEFAIGGTDTKDRFKFCPYCGKYIPNYDKDGYDQFGLNKNGYRRQGGKPW